MAEKDSMRKDSEGTTQSRIQPETPVPQLTWFLTFKKRCSPLRKFDVSDFPGAQMDLKDTRPPPNVSLKHQAMFWRKKSDTEHDDSASDAASQRPNQAYRSLETIRAQIDEEMAFEPQENQTAYDKKARVINMAISDIGMGRYQWQMFLLCGMGWASDNLWLQSVAIILPSLSTEFGISSSTIRFVTLALFTGLCFGAFGWGMASDIIGRQLAFNVTLMITSVFAFASIGSFDLISAGALYACLGLGVGGNLPVDGALFLEFLPNKNRGMLTLLSGFWPIGTMIASLVAWPLMVNYGCPEDLKSCRLVADGQPCCSKENNMGWRYFIITMGLLTTVGALCRFFVETFETPKNLLARGKQGQAVAVIHGLAYKNKTKTWLTEDILNQIGGLADEVNRDKLPMTEQIRRNASKFSSGQIRPLFKSTKMGVSTALVWFIWAAIGMGYPLFNAFLPQYLGGNGESINTTYRNYAITSIVGLPGSIIAFYTVAWGRKWTMAAAMFITGMFLFLFTTSKNSDLQLLFSCLEAFFQNTAYGVLYAYTPEVFPGPSRGTGSGMASCLNRIAGLCAPLVAIYASSASPSAPIYASGGLFFAAGLATLVLPLETADAETI